MARRLAREGYELGLIARSAATVDAANEAALRDSLDDAGRTTSPSGTADR